MQQLVLPSPAKINLCLRIIGKRADGYHNLQTIMQTLAFGDEIKLILRRDAQIILHNPIKGVPNVQNLIIRSAKILQQFAPNYGVDIYLVKNIPQGAGLGGGSSNAATVLLGLNKLWQLDFSLTKLAEFGLQLGADVPFFIYGKSALIEGIGEQITPIELRAKWCVLIMPPVSVATATIFKAKQLTRNSKTSKLCALLVDKQNDCTTTVMQLYTQVKQAIFLLNQYAKARLSGTGSSVFALFDDEKQAQKVMQAISPKMNCIVTQTLNRSLLHEQLTKSCN